MIKKYKNNIILFYAAAVIALIAAAFCDLELDKFLNNPEDIFSIWFRNTGEMPGRLIFLSPVQYCFIHIKTN